MTMNEYLDKIRGIIESSRDFFRHLNLTDTRRLQTDYREIPEEISEERLKKIPREMREALAACGKIFNKCQYPWAMMGSNALVLEADTKKKGDDLDVIFAIQDFKKIYESLKKLASAKEVKSLKIDEMRNFKNELNGCFRISGKIKTGKTFTFFEAFSQNIDPNKTKNGIVNLGLEKHGINVYEIPDVNNRKVPVNMLDKNGVEELYLKNLLNEFGLYDLKSWIIRREFLKPKALQRFVNLQNMGYSAEEILNALPAIEIKTEMAGESRKFLEDLWQDFKSRNLNGPGLVKTLSTRLNLHYNRYRSEKIADMLTKQTEEDMKIMATSENAKIISLINEKYDGYLNLTRSKDIEIDFAPYASLLHLKNYFIKPILKELSIN